MSRRSSASQAVDERIFSLCSNSLNLFLPTELGGYANHASALEVLLLTSRSDSSHSPTLHCKVLNETARRGLVWERQDDKISTPLVWSLLIVFMNDRNSQTTLPKK